MKIHTNFSIGDILRETDGGTASTELIWLREAIEDYRTAVTQQLEDAMERLRAASPEEPMGWISENVDIGLRHYCRCRLHGKDFNVLMKNAGQWKRLSDIGIPVEPPENVPIDYTQWYEEWKNEGSELAAVNSPVYETHAHYDLDCFNPVRDELLELIFQSGISHCIIPAIGFQTCHEMKSRFDSPEYGWISYAFGSHPKYLCKEHWTEDTWAQLDTLISDPKCVAIGEAGLDYSYKDCDSSHRANQQYFFRRFIETANRRCLPMILHIRPADDASVCEFDATADALEILRVCRPVCGAVVHCFGGSIEDAEKYIGAGVAYFGIGGRIFYGDKALEKAVTQLPEESILLETDSPFVKPEADRKPNTSLSLLRVADRTAQLRGTTTQHILRISYENAKRLFGVG